MQRIILLVFGLTVLIITFATQVVAGPVLDEIKASGKIICLVNTNSPGFSTPDSKGVFQGFNVDFCRMAAAAIFGDTNKADIRGINFSDSMKTLVARKAHMASRSITCTGTRDTDPGMVFVVTTLYDGQGFMVPDKLGIKSATELSGATVCAEEGSTTLLNIADWFGNRKMTYKVENIGDKTARLQAFYAGKCDVLASDYTTLLSDRELAPNPSDYTILPEIISNEPLSLICQPDQELESILFWGFQVMLTADQYGITSQNVDSVIKDLANQPKAVGRLFGEESAAGDMAEKLQIPRNWTYKIIKQVGNYDEVFERHLGKNTPFKLDRKGTLNDLSSRGGLMYAYPIR
jgi:general L-amino acid transport system substrate-binding protein